MIAASGGEFEGNYTDICYYFSVTAQSKNRNNIRSALEALASDGYIVWQRRGRTHSIKIKPKATEIKISSELANSIIRHDYTSENVAWEQVLKLYIWICNNKMGVVKNSFIEADIDASEATVVSAKKVLLAEYESITKKDVCKRFGGDLFIRTGQELQISDAWKNISK